MARALQRVDHLRAWNQMKNPIAESRYVAGHEDDVSFDQLSFSGFVLLDDLTRDLDIVRIAPEGSRIDS